LFQQQQKRSSQVLPQVTETILKYFGRSRIQQALKMTSEDQLQQPSTRTPKTKRRKQKLKADEIQEELRNIDLHGITLESSPFQGGPNSDVVAFKRGFVT